MKKILFLTLAMMCSLSNVFAQSWTSGQQVGNGTFYFYNISAQRYLGQGTKWKTHAVVDGAGMEIGVSTFQNGVSLHTGLTSGSGQYVGIRDDGEVFMDFPQTEFVCEAVNVSGYTNAYKLKCTKGNTTYYLGWTGEGNVETSNEVITTTTDPSNNNNFLWLLIRPQDRTYDVTNLITNPDFEYWGSRDTYDECQGFNGWDKSYNTQSNPYDRFKKHNSTTSFTSGLFCEAWVWPGNNLGPEYIKQSINISTAGYYTLTVTGQAVNQQTGNACSNGVKLYLRQNSNTQSTIIGAAGTHSVTMHVESGSLELGVEIENGNDANWVAFDNVRLYYHSDAPATYTQSGNTLEFRGAGWLDKKTFNMTDYTVIVGNPNVDAEKAKVKYSDYNVGAYVTDRNGFDHAFYNATTKLPLGYGTYYTIIPKTDGFLKLEVKAINGGNDTPLIFVDASGNVDEFIPYSEISSGFTSVDCGFVEAGKVYYLYSRTWATLLLHKTEFTTVPQHLASLPYNMIGTTAGWSLVEENDFDQYGESYQNTHVWTMWKQRDCTLNVDANSNHGPYAYYALGLDANGKDENSRAAYYPFENLESRKRYIIEFDAWIKPGNNQVSQIALYRNLPDQNASVEDYIMSVKIPANGGTWKFYVRGDNNAETEVLSTNNLSNETWYHFLLDVDARTPNNYKIGIIVQDENNNIIAQTNGMVPFTGNGTAKGIYYLSGRYKSQAKFDNIAIFSNQGSLGSVSTPQIELTGVNGTKRTVTVTGGVADLNFDVTTYYDYIAVDNSYNTTWDNILNSNSWTSWGNTGAVAKINQPSSNVLPEFNPTSKTTYIIRAISTINDYSTVLSDTAYLRVVAGETWTLSGGFEVVAMNKENDGYYTPTLRAYVDTGILPHGTNVNMAVTYVPVDYGTHNPVDNTPYPDGYTPDPVRVEGLTWTTPENSSVTYSSNFVVPRSADYILNLSATGFNDGAPTRRFYKDKYKVTYSTPDFASVTDPVNDFANFDKGFTDNLDYSYGPVWGYTSWSREVSTNDGNKNIWQTVAPKTVPGWATSTDYDYTWNGKETTKTATLNLVRSAHSSASYQDYTIRTNQTSTENALILKVGYGLVKNANTAWNFRCGLAHIGMGNEIPEFAYDTEKGNGHNIHYAYPNPYITGSNVPECNYSVPAYAALKQYRVYTPVETKTIPATSGLASFSSYYSLYHVADFYMNNDELVGSFYAPSHYKFGGSYYLNKTWYMKDRNGFLVAANIYNEKDIWQGYKDYVQANPWNGEDLTIELRIIDETPTNIWSANVENELMPVLMDDERVNHSSDRITITGSSTGNNNGWPNMILYKGKRNDDVCYNFFCLPSATSKAKMANKTSYLQRTGNTYADYINSQSSVKEEGERIFFGMVGNDDEAVGIDMVESNMNATGNDTFYNLAGQRVSTPTKGIYIHNGKKVLVK